jgi:hypothetical protein
MTGILIVRQLTKIDYAYFGIASTIASVIISTSIGGLGSYLISEGVKIRENVKELSLMFSELRLFISKKERVIIVISIPIICFLLLRNNIGITQLIVFLIIVIIDTTIRVRTQLIQSIFNLSEKFTLLQSINLVASTSRLLAVGASFFFLSSEIAYGCTVLSYLVQYFLLKKKVKSYVIEIHSSSRERFSFFQKLYLSQLPVNLYTYLDSQIGIFIVTFFGNTILLADINAAGKLSLIVVAVNAFVNNFMIVKFSKIQEWRKFVRRLILTVLVFFGFYLIALLISLLFPQLFIFVIGDKYQNISSSIYLTVIAICLSNFSGLIYSFNYSKMWIQKSWIAIPITIGLQILMLIFYSPSNFERVWHYAIISIMPNLFVNLFQCIKGIKEFRFRTTK